MKSFYIGDRYILTEGFKNSVIIDFDKKRVTHINNELAKSIISKKYSDISRFSDCIDVNSLVEEKISLIQSQKNTKSKHKKLWFDISGVCNLKCRGCYAEPYMQGSAQGFVDNNLIRAVKEFGKYFEQLDILGGEPFVNPQLPYILKVLGETFDKVTVYTNGTVLKEDIIGICKETDVFIKISLYGINAKDHDSFTQKKGSFEKTLTFIDICKKKGVRIQIGYLITDLSAVKDRKLITDYLKEIGIDYKLDAERSKGKILNDGVTKRFFNFKQKEQYLNNLFHHPCVNRKMGIDVNGGLYYCPMERSNNRGHITKGNAQASIAKIESDWTKSISERYRDCKICEFRGLCFDCFVLDPEKSDHPINCVYDPNEGGYRGGVSL